jgi:hypothetical protein
VVSFVDMVIPFFLWYVTQFWTSPPSCGHFAKRPQNQHLLLPVFSKFSSCFLKLMYNFHSW